MSTGPDWELQALLDALVAAQEEVHEDLRVYDWRPNGRPETPCIYHRLEDSPLEQNALGMWEDRLAIRVFLGVGYDVIDEQMGRATLYADRWRAVMDPVLHQESPLDGTCEQAWRQRMRTGHDDFGGFPVFTFEFLLEIRVPSVIPPGP